MTNWILEILQLTESCLIETKITKKFFKTNFELTMSERLMLEDSSIVVGINWLASISPKNSNIPAIKNPDSTFVEIQVIAIQTTNQNFDKYKIKLAEFIQKYIPYHILLIVYCDNKLIFNTCTKRININDSNKRVMDLMLITDEIPNQEPTSKISAFLNSLKYINQDKPNLKVLYESYIQKLVALQTSEITGEFAPRTNERTIQDVERMEQINLLKSEIVQLQNKAKKESQLNKRVELNTLIHSKKEQIELIKNLLTAL
jgi:hypothetical protein